MYYLGKTSKERLQGVDPRLIEIIELALTFTKYDFGIPIYGGLRSEEDQLSLFLDGKSKCDGDNIRSTHQDGLAFDIFGYKGGKATWDELILTSIAAAILQAASMLGYKLNWGGLWKGFVDAPHFELVES